MPTIVIRGGLGWGHTYTARQEETYKADVWLVFPEPFFFGFFEPVVGALSFKCLVAFLGEGSRGNGERRNGSENFSALLSTLLTILIKNSYSQNL